MSFKIHNNTNNKLTTLSNNIEKINTSINEMITEINKMPKVFKVSPLLTQIVYEDDILQLVWDGVNKQPKYLIKVQPEGEWINGGIFLIKDDLYLSEASVLSTEINSEYYFNNNGIRNNNYDLNLPGSIAKTWLTSENDSDFPTYHCKWILGSSDTNLTIVIEKY